MTEEVSRQSTFTLAEAAYAIGEDVKSVTRLVDEHADLVNKAIVGRRDRRLLGNIDLIYMEAVRELRDVLTPVGRRKLHEALIGSGTRAEVEVGSFKLPLAPLKKKVQERIEGLERLKETVEGDLDNPLIKGSKVEAYRIAALLAGGATVEEVEEDYPSLTALQIRQAADYARAIPKKGHPFPEKSFKRSSRALDLHLIDTNW